MSSVKHIVYAHMDMQRKEKKRKIIGKTKGFYQEIEALDSISHQILTTNQAENGDFVILIEDT